jgi:hypothetical protein
MPDPDGRAGAEMVMQFNHVLNDLFEGIGIGGSGRRRTAVAAHVWRDAIPAFRGEGLDLRAPHQADLGPAVEEDHEWAASRSGLPVVRRVTWRTERHVDECEGWCQRELL